MKEIELARKFLGDLQMKLPLLRIIRIADVPLSRVSGRNFNRKRYVDHILCFPPFGTMVAIEWKKVVGPSVRFDVLEPTKKTKTGAFIPGQLEELERIGFAGGLSLIGVFQVIDGDQKLYFFTPRHWRKLQLLANADWHKSRKSFRLIESNSKAYRRMQGIRGKLTWEIPPFGEWIKNKHKGRTR